MLNEGRNGLDGQGILRSASIGHILLIAHAKIPFSCGDQRGRHAVRRLNDADIEPLLLIKAQFLGHIHSGVVGVDGVVQNDGDVAQGVGAVLLAALLDIVSFLLLPLVGAAGKRQRTKRQRHEQRKQFFAVFHVSFSFSSGVF